MKTSYKIVEVFYSLQGEGRLAGTPCMFVRFFGCNLKCSWCDEPLHKDKDCLKFSYDNAKDCAEALESVRKSFGNDICHIVFTGGEPSMYDINSLVDAWHGVIGDDLKLYFSVETNGFAFENVTRCNLITFSPKGSVEDTTLKLSHLHSLLQTDYKSWFRQGLDLKIVASGSVDSYLLETLADSKINALRISFIKLCNIYTNRGGVKLFVSPLCNEKTIDTESLDWCIRWIKKNPKVSGSTPILSLQQHKVWGIR